MSKHVDIQRRGPTARVFLNRPELRNSFNDEVVAEFTDAKDAPAWLPG
jgi:methylglutaconyl-CoA hydratase